MLLTMSAFRRSSSVVRSKRGSEDAWERWEEMPVHGGPHSVPPQEEEQDVSAALPEEGFDWRKELRDLAQSQQPQQVQSDTLMFILSCHI